MRPSRGMGAIEKSKMPKGMAAGGKAKGKQFVKQPKTIAKKTASYR